MRSRHLPSVATVAHISARSTAVPSDAALVASARAGEAWAREALFRRHARLANGLAFRLLGRDQEVDDVVQDAYVAVLDGLHRLDDPQAFASFLASIVVRRVRRVLRRRRLARSLGLMPPAVPIDPTGFIASTAPPDAMAELRSIYAVVEALPTDERLALLLRRVEGLPLEEVARLCGCSLATVKRRIAAAEAKLAKEQEPPSDAPSRVERTGT
jgi:RNA polymerase sigma-70 factor (ECF subfamily)